MGNKYQYTKIIILGSGKLAYECALESRKYLESTEVLEYKVTDSTVLEKCCEKSGISYQCCEKSRLKEILLNQTESTLVVSAGNTYLIPKCVIEKKNLMIINWHNALLPRHKGRNAESWSIYAGDSVTGITWHRITEDVDAGDIIARREISIEPTMTALKLFQKQCVAGAEVFGEILESVLTGESVFTKQSPDLNREMHYSHEVPNNGYVDLNWSVEQLSCFLRAMDYGALQLLGVSHVQWKGKEYIFRKYKIQEDQDSEQQEDDVFMEDDNLIIRRGMKKIILRGLEQI